MLLISDGGLDFQLQKDTGFIVQWEERVTEWPIYNPQQGVNSQEYKWYCGHRQSMPLIPLCSHCICHMDLLIVKDYKAGKAVSGRSWMVFVYGQYWLAPTCNRCSSLVCMVLLLCYFIFLVLRTIVTLYSWLYTVFLFFYYCKSIIATPVYSIQAEHIASSSVLLLILRFLPSFSLIFPYAHRDCRDRGCSMLHKLYQLLTQTFCDLGYIKNLTPLIVKNISYVFLFYQSHTFVFCAGKNKPIYFLQYNLANFCCVLQVHYFS